MTMASNARKISHLLRAISQPSRLEILLAIGTGEACVCHLEAYLGQRQAYISQHLMALREAGIVGARREGRNIFYYLKDNQTLDLVQQAAGLAGILPDDLQFGTPATIVSGCTCPHCCPDGDCKPNLIDPIQLLAESH
jgi:DNA-binding transcriptional ArsR family regulator